MAIESGTQKIFQFEKDIYASQVSKMIILLVGLLGIFIGGLIIEMPIIILVLVFFPVCFIILIYFLIYTMKQKSYCLNMRVIVDIEHQEMTVERLKSPLGKITIPFSNIESIKYYTSAFPKSNAGYKSKQISIEHLTIKTKDDRIIYLGYFYKLYKYLSVNKEKLPFTINIHTNSFQDQHNRDSLIPELYNNDEISQQSEQEINHSVYCSVIFKLIGIAILALAIYAFIFFTKYYKTHPTPKIEKQESKNGLVWVDSNNIYVTFEHKQSKRHWRQDWELDVYGRKDNKGIKETWLRLHAVYYITDEKAFEADSNNKYTITSTKGFEKSFPKSVVKDANLNFIANMYLNTEHNGTIELTCSENKIHIYDGDGAGYRVLYYAFYPIDSTYMQYLSEQNIESLYIPLELSGIEGIYQCSPDPSIFMRLNKMFQLVEHSLDEARVLPIETN